jgi:hypothetical protein
MAAPLVAALLPSTVDGVAVDICPDSARGDHGHTGTPPDSHFRRPGVSARTHEPPAGVAPADAWSSRVPVSSDPAVSLRCCNELVMPPADLSAHAEHLTKQRRRCETFARNRVRCGNQLPRLLARHGSCAPASGAVARSGFQVDLVASGAIQVLSGAGEAVRARDAWRAEDIRRWIHEQGRANGSSAA